MNAMSAGPGDTRMFMKAQAPHQVVGLPRVARQIETHQTPRNNGGLPARGEPSARSLANRFGQIVCLAASLCACQSSPKGEVSGNTQQPNPPALSEDAYPGQLRPMSEVPHNFVLRQQLTGSARGHQFRGETVLQKQGDTLTLIGLSPFGSRAFTLIQRGDTVEYTEHMPQPLPFPARFMLIDIHRTLFVGLLGPREDGRHTEVVGDEQISEEWAGGRLQMRSFSRVDGHPAGTIVIRYQGGYRPGEAPQKVTLDNSWFGYQLEVETLMYQAI